MKNKIKYTIIFFLIISNAFFFLLVKYSARRTSVLRERVSDLTLALDLNEKNEDLENTFLGCTFNMSKYLHGQKSIKYRKNFQSSDKPFSLILIFGNIGCSTCLSREITNLKDLYKTELPHIDVTAIALSGEMRDIRRFVRVHRIKYPLFYKTDTDILSRFPLNTEIALIIVQNTYNKIVACHIPKPGQEERSALFKNFISRLGSDINI